MTTRCVNLQALSTHHDPTFPGGGQGDTTRAEKGSLSRHIAWQFIIYSGWSQGEDCHQHGHFSPNPFAGGHDTISTRTKDGVMATDPSPSSPVPPLSGADNPISPGKWGFAGIKRSQNLFFATFLLEFLLLVGIVINGWLLMSGVIRDLKGVRDTLGQPALWRSAYFSQGDKFAGYILFLNENIPPGGRVVLPPVGFGPKALGTTPFMQFFLIPRPVINCLDEACAQKISVENTSILVVEEFPGETVTLKFGTRLMFNNKWGVLKSAGSESAGNPVHPGFTHLVDILLAALWPLLWLGVMTLSGFIWVGFAAPYLPGTVKMALGYGLGLGALTIGLSLAWLAGVRIGAASVLWVSGLLVALALMAR